MSRVGGVCLLDFVRSAEAIWEAPTQQDWFIFSQIRVFFLLHCWWHLWLCTCWMTIWCLNESWDEVDVWTVTWRVQGVLIVQRTRNASSNRKNHVLGASNLASLNTQRRFFWFLRNRQKHKITFSSFRLLLLSCIKSFSDCDLSEPVLLSDYLFINFCVLWRARKIAIVK